MEEENPPRFPRKHGTQIESTSMAGVGPTQKNSCTCRHTSTTSSSTTTNSSSAEEGEDLIECSGNYCGSCAAGLIADCVALCCCPCALINILAFAFVKVPWMVGRKCVGKVRRKKKKKLKVGGGDHDQTAEDDDEGGGGNGNLRKIRVEDGILLEIVGSDQEMGGFEAEKVWLELYKDGHLGFGRVSFTGIP